MMVLIQRNLLITGLPGVGKTTLIKRLSEELKPLHPVGFYTAEIREGGERLGFELISLDGRRRDPASQLIIIDEIGRMECFSGRFKKLLIEVLDSEKWVVATVALKGTGLIEEVRQRKDVKLFEISERNRDHLLSEILKEINEPFLR